MTKYAMNEFTERACYVVEKMLDDGRLPVSEDEAWELFRGALWKNIIVEQIIEMAEYLMQNE